MNRTNISWLQNPDGSKGYTWNPVTGCTPVSEACANCYARRLAETRLRGRCGYPLLNPFQVTLHPERLDEPIDLKRPSRIFPVSMGDLFHPEVPDDFIDRVFITMARADWHEYFLMTKRPERMLAYRNKTNRARCGFTAFENYIWLGASIESQAYIRRAAPLVELARMGWHAFVSVEPMLAPVFLQPFLAHGGIPGLEWVICGGETGPDAREMDLLWATDLWHQCIVAGVPFHFKHPGDWWPDKWWLKVRPDEPSIVNCKEFPQ